MELSDRDDEPNYPPQALPIGKLAAGDKPQDGLQYLSLVQSEAKVIPDVMAVDRTLFHNPDADQCDGSENRFKLPQSVVNKRVRKFSQLRQYCCRMQKLHPSRLQGDDMELAISKKLFDDEPCLSVILSLSQVTIFELLEYIEDVCLSQDKVARLPTCTSSWMFSLLCVVDKPVPMDYMAVIRGIGRRCAALCRDLLGRLQELESCMTDPSFQYLVLFILVCHYFEQVDLLDEAVA